jgi:WD40 repeat protein
LLPVAPDMSLTAVAYLPDGKAVVAGDAAGKVWVIDLEKKAVRHTFDGHRGPVLCLAVAPDGKTVASGGADTTVLVWDLTKVTP